MSMSKYLKSKNLTKKDKTCIFNMRTRMINCKCNFKSAYVDLTCDYCKITLDDQSHIPYCPTTNNQVPSVQYDPFSQDDEVLKMLAVAMTNSLTRREQHED